ncbi:MAG: hypothetical protein ACI974_000477, partial [Paraglaciecola sp.]
HQHLTHKFNIDRPLGARELETRKLKARELVSPK